MLEATTRIGEYSREGEGPTDPPRKLVEADELRGKSRVEILRDRNPIEFLNKRADALTQKAADLKKLAEAWQPLYQTLTQRVCSKIQ